MATRRTHGNPARAAMEAARVEDEAMLKEGIACYQDYLRGLLDLTDNLVRGAVVPPPQVNRPANWLFACG